MTVEQLEKMASDMYHSSANDLPETHLSYREDWMAHKIERAIQEKGPLFRKLLAAGNRMEVIHLLRGTYIDKTYADAYDSPDD
ncbi:MAG: hypothetical protein LIP06_05125 [Tannerellaceae bacterium]|nr:hypothetical protein [Tannerellaceae bacterium]